MSKEVMIKCSCCGGRGKVPLDGVYFETLKMLSKERKEIHGAALARKSGCNSTAMNNRLARLEQLGLVKSRKYGRKKLYRTNGTYGH